MYNVYVNGEWIFHGDYDSAMQVAERYWFDDEFYGDCEIVED